MATTSPKQRTHNQVRGFVIVWTFITLIMGLATFFAIYITYQVPSSASGNTVALANAGDRLVVIASQTPAPTNTPQPTQPPTDEPVAVAQAATESPTEVIPPTNTPEPTPIPPDEDPTFQIGIQVQTPQDLNRDVLIGYYRSTRQDLGAPWIKVQVRWELYEPQQGQYSWESLDLAMFGARYFGIRPMLSIVTAPDWAREPGISLDRHGPPADNATYVNFVRAILERYSGQVYGIEVWNEQNIDREWTSMGGLSATNYVSLLRDTYNMVQEVSPGTIVISGALSPTGLDDGIRAIDDFRYMQQMIDAGMLNYTDCVGAHHNGYNIGPLVRFDAVPNDPTAIFRGPFDNPHHSWSFRSTLEGYITRIRNSGSDKKLCVTEFGWAVTEDLSGVPAGFEFARDNTLEEQAQFFVEALDYMEQSGNFWLAFIWNFNYGPQVGFDPTNDNVPYSLLSPNGFRPAYDAIREWQRNYAERLGQS